MSWNGTYNEVPYTIGGNLMRYNINSYNWEDITANVNNVSSGIMDECRISATEMHPSDVNTAWITFGNFSDHNKIYQTTDGGSIWTNISHDLENIPVNTVAYDEQADWLYIGTDVGVFYLTDVSGGSDQTWECYGDFPLVIASDIKINKQTRELVVATYGQGVWRADLSCAYNETAQSINTNTTWSGSHTITNDWSIESGATLTIPADAYIKFMQEATLTINPGAKLIINGGTLTNSCGEIWQGIQVLGNPNLNQQVASNQGVIEMSNDAVIENAITAISAGNGTDNSQNGGIIKINGAIFRNNITSISIPAYHNFIFEPGIYGNQSYIKHSSFITTDELANEGFNPNSHILLAEVEGVLVQNNTFINENPEAYGNTQQGNGLRCINASCGANANNYENLSYGVKAGGVGQLNSLTVSESEFTNNYIGIQVDATDDFSIKENVFNSSNANQGIVVLNNNATFQIEENIFNGSNNTTGIYLSSNTGASNI